MPIDDNPSHSVQPFASHRELRRSTRAKSRRWFVESCEDRRLLAAAGLTDVPVLLEFGATGGSGTNMFALKFENGYQNLPSRSYLKQARQLGAPVTGVYAAGSSTFVAESDGTLLKYSSSGALTGYQLFSAPVTGLLYSASADVVVVGLGDGRMLKSKGTGGGGENMFAVTETASGFATVPGYSYLLGSQKFSSGVAGLYDAGSQTWVALNNHLLVKFAGIGGTGANMFAVSESGGTVTGLSGHAYWKGTQTFTADVVGLAYSSGDNRTLVATSDGRMLKVNGVGGTGQNMFAVTATASGYATVPGYTLLAGSQKFAQGIDEFWTIAGYTFVALDNGAGAGSLVKFSGTGGTGTNMFAVSESGGTVTGLSGYAFWKGTQQFGGLVTDVVYSAAENVTVMGLSDGQMLKVRGVGGTGQNMFAISATTAGYVNLPSHTYLVGSQRFDVGVGDLYVDAVGGLRVGLNEINTESVYVTARAPFVGPGAARLIGTTLQLFDGTTWSVNNTRTFALVRALGGQAVYLLNDGKVQVQTNVTTCLTVGTQGVKYSASLWALGTTAVDAVGSRRIYRYANLAAPASYITSPTIGNYWFGSDAARSAAGVPLGSVVLGAGYHYQDFSRGRLFYSAKGFVLIPGTTGDVNSLLGAFVAAGGEARLGFPTSSAGPARDVAGTSVGSVQYFENGALFFSNAVNRAFHVSKHIADVYLSAQNGTRGLGAPLAAKYDDLLETVKFTNGAIYWSPATDGRILGDTATLHALGQVADDDAVFYGTSGWSSPAAALKKAGTQKFGLHASAEGYLNLNLLQQTAYTNLNFMGFHFDTAFFESLAKGEVKSGNVDVFEVLTSLVKSTVTNNYDSVRFAAYGTGGVKADNVYLSSARFVDWASPQTIARLVAQAVFGASEASKNELKKELLAELKSVLAWAARRFGDEKTAVLKLAEAAVSGKLHLTAKPVQYTYNLLGKEVKENHLGFTIEVDGFPTGTLAPQAKNLSLGSAAAQVAQGVTADFLQTTITNAAIGVFNQIVGGNLQASSFDAGSSAAETALNVAMYQFLIGKLGPTMTLLTQAYNLYQNPVINLLSPQLKWKGPQQLETAINEQLHKFNGDLSFHITTAIFNTSTCELTFKVRVDYDHNWGTLEEIATKVGNSLSDWGKSEGGKVANWFKKEAGNMANWIHDNLQLDPVTGLPIPGKVLPPWAAQAVANLPAVLNDMAAQGQLGTTAAKALTNTANSMTNKVRTSPVGKAVHSLATGGGLGLTDVGFFAFYV